MINCNIYNPTKTPRIIHDGIDGSQRPIRINPGKTVSAMLDVRMVDRLLDMTDDLIVTEHEPRPIVAVESKMTNGTLSACYDLSVSPPTYDYISFLVAAETARIDAGLSDINIHILPGPRDGFRRDSLPPYTAQEREHMRDAIVVPASRLLSSCNVVACKLNREKPAEPTFGFGRPVHGFGTLFKAAQRGIFPLRATDSLGEPMPKTATITLREAPYWPTRNGDVAEWMAVAGELRRQGWRVIFVRDTSKADKPIDDFEIDPTASRSILHRAVLYQKASLNLFTNNGPAWMCLYMGASCMIFRMTALNAPCANENYFRHHGWRRGEPWPNLAARQHVSWEPDKFAPIMAAIEKYA